MTPFENIIDLVYKALPLQRNKLKKYLSRQDATFFSDAEEFAAQYLRYLHGECISMQYAIGAYVKLCNEMITYQIRFMKTGRYPTIDSSTAYRNVYSNPVEMKSYMIGLAISQFLWPTHYQIYRCFGNYIKCAGPTISNYLEVGPGHGLFLCKAISHLKSDAEVEVVDISDTAVEISQSIVECQHKGLADNIRYHIKDFIKYDSMTKYDFITMGEVLEHIENPERFLTKLSELLTPTGKAFISTCVNAPAIDHIYHFKSIEEIRNLFKSVNLLIVEDHVFPVEDIPMDEIIEKNTTINYCALVKKDNK